MKYAIYLFHGPFYCLILLAKIHKFYIVKFIISVAPSSFSNGSILFSSDSYKFSFSYTMKRIFNYLFIFHFLKGSY